MRNVMTQDTQKKQSADLKLETSKTNTTRRTFDDSSKALAVSYP